MVSETSAVRLIRKGRDKGFRFRLSHMGLKKRQNHISLLSKRVVFKYIDFNNPDSEPFIMTGTVLKSTTIHSILMVNI